MQHHLTDINRLIREKLLEAQTIFWGVGMKWKCAPMNGDLVFFF